MNRNWRAALLGTATVFSLHAAVAVLPDPILGTRLASAQDAGELEPDDLEAALAEEQARQEASQRLEEQLSGPYAAFNEAYEATIAQRQRAAVELVRSALITDGCNMGRLEEVQYAPDLFVLSDTLTRGKDELQGLHTSATEDGKTVELEFSSEAPPSVTETVVGEIKRTMKQIEALNAEYARSCVEQERISQLPATQANEIMAVSLKLESEQAELSAKLDQVVIDMNGRIDRIDEALIAWLAAPLRNLQAAE